MNPIQTSRLLLREATLEDAGFFHALMNSEGWLAYIGDRGIHDQALAGKYIENSLVRHYGDHGYGLWVVTLREGGESIGICGPLRRAGLDLPDLGFAFLPQYCGLGYALEAAEATVDYCARNLGESDLLAITLEVNRRSIRLLEKLGMEFQRMVVLPGSQEELMLFGMRLKRPASDSPIL